MTSTLCYNLKVTDEQYDFILNSEYGKFLGVDVLETEELLEIFALELPQHSTVEIKFLNEGKQLEIKSEMISMFYDNPNKMFSLTIRKPNTLLMLG